MFQEIENLLKLAHAKGASDAEVYHISSFSRPVVFEANRLKQLESSQATGYALRLWLDSRPGLAVAYGNVEAEALVEKALALTQLNPQETIELNQARSYIHNEPELSFSSQELVEIGKKAIEDLRSASPELICSASLECEQETTTLINSRGLYCKNTDISLSYFLGVELIRGEDFLAIYDGEQTREKLDPSSVVRQIIQRLEWAKKNVSPPTGKVPVLFTSDAVVALWGTVASALNSKLVLEKSSPWSDKQGSLVVSDILTLSQQPTTGPYSCPFDDEGTLTQELSLIRNGILEQFYSDRTTARALGVNSSGNGFRPSLGRYPTPELVNLVIEPGSKSLQELISSIEEGIVIDQILGGEPDISGDFSINVDLGYRINKGEIIGRVKDTMVAGNVYTALKQVKEVGGDRAWCGSCYTPSLIVEGLSVVG